MFLDRERELALLEERYASDKAELFVLYGRRRVGKTELLTRFCGGKRHIFFVADSTAEPALRARFSAAVNREILGEAAAAAAYPDWESVFRTVSEAARAERLVVVLDEFTYLLGAHPPLASILQRLWDASLRHTRVMLVLCGSYVGMMESSVLGYRAPLYGRRTAQVLLEPLGFHDARLFLPTYDADDQVRAYAVFGGTPAYLQIAAAGGPLDRVIAEQILTRGTFLYDEVGFLLQQELREPRNYFAVLEAIAAGRTRLNEIKQATGIEGVTSYLATLQELRLVERVVPVTETQTHKSRRGLYRLRDPFVRFWLRFVHPNRTLLERGGADLVLDSTVMPQLDTFTGAEFERVCEQFLWRLAIRDRLPFRPLRIGGWWTANAEVDLVAAGEGGALVVECKWSARPVGTDVLAALEAKAASVPLPSRDRVFFGLCARSGFTEALRREVADRDDVLLFDLAAILGG